MALIKSDLLSKNKDDIQKFFFFLGVLLSVDYCLLNSLKNTEMLIICLSIGTVLRNTILRGFFFFTVKHFTELSNIT